MSVSCESDCSTFTETGTCACDQYRLSHVTLLVSIVQNDGCALCNDAIAKIRDSRSSRSLGEDVGEPVRIDRFGRDDHIDRLAQTMDLSVARFQVAKELLLDFL